MKSLLIIILLSLPFFESFAGGRVSPRRQAQAITEGKFCGGDSEIAWYCGAYPKGEGWIPQGNMCFHRDTLLPCGKDDNDITIGKIKTFGMSRGCPVGSFSATPSPDNKQISVLFNSYSISYDSSLQEYLDPFYYNRDCSFVIPVKIPKGQQVSIQSTDFRGFVSIPEGGRFSFWSALKYSEDFNEFVDNFKNWNEVRHDFPGPLNQEFAMQLDEGNRTWSPCGQDLYIWINSGMNLFSNPQRDEVTASIDSLDIQMQPGMNVNLDLRECH